MSKTFEGVSILVGAVVGAGILGIPYVVMKSGFLIGMIILILVFLMLTLLKLYMGEITLRTKKNYQLAGYAEKYLGKKGKTLMILTFAFGVYSALLAYLIGEGRSLSYLITGTAQYEFILGISFWCILSAMTYYGLKALRDGESLGFVLILILITSITTFFWNKIDFSNLNYINLANFYVPFGVILFAFMGFSAIPEMERVIDKDKKLTKRIIIIANSAILIFYILFTLVVLGSQGANTPQVATITLGKPFILLGILTMFTSYLALSIAFMDSLILDYKKSRAKAWMITISIPIIIFMLLQLTNAASFVKVLGIGGTVTGSLLAILVLFMVKNAKKKCSRKPEYSLPYSNTLAYIIIAIFIIGTILEIFNTTGLI